MTTRAEIAAALSTATDVTGYAYRPIAPRPGDAWPLLTGYERAEGMAFYAVRRVIVFLPQDERAASDWMDEHIDALVDALEPVGFVDRIEPVELSTSAGNQFALEIVMRGE